jgi:hypothetical protein
MATTTCVEFRHNLEVKSMFNGVTTVIVRDGLEMLVGCYFAHLATRSASGWRTTKQAAAVLVLAVLIGIILHGLISGLDDHWVPFEMAFNLIVPAIILYYCLTHLPGRKHKPQQGAYFAPLLVFGETMEITISTLEQNGREIRDGVASGLLVLGVVVVITWAISHLLERSLGDIVKRQMARTMALLNLTVGGFGFYVLLNARDVMKENKAAGYWLPIMVAYVFALAWVVIVTIRRFPSRSAPLHHHAK